MVATITFPEVERRGAIVLRKPTAVSIESGWKMLTDTAKIVFPRKLHIDKSPFDPQKVKELFQKGDPVTIDLGYGFGYNREFEGYLTHISADMPITLSCEDEMWKLKQLPVHISLPATTLPQLLKAILPGYEIDAQEVELGPQRFPNTTVAKVLEYLKQEYSLYSYMNGKKLICGKIYEDDADTPVTPIHLERNVVNSSLNYKSKEDVSIKITAISTLRNGDKIEVVVGDEGGEERQLSYYGITVRAELKKLAEQDLKKYKVDGFDGTIKTFGVPKIDHGRKVALTSDLYPDRNGTYYVEEVKIDFNDTPEYRRTIKLGDKVNG